MGYFGAFPVWLAVFRMIAVGYRYLSPVPGMSVAVRIPAEGVCRDRQAKGADGAIGQTRKWRVFGLQSPPQGVRLRDSSHDSVFRHRPDGRYPARGESREQAG